MIVDLNVLEKASHIIFEYWQKEGIQKIEVEEDFYWNISTKERYDPYKEPQDLDLGQLSDDWSEIEKIASGKTEPIIYALVWLASIYKILGEKNLN
ncbi:MAG: hypothetical protein ACRC2R_27535 [Xenococcaceae cyanobacterium]